MGRFGGRGRGGGRGGGRGRGKPGVPFKPGPTLGRAIEDAIAARHEDDGDAHGTSGWDEMGGRPKPVAGKKSVLDRKTMRKQAKADKAAQRQSWATRHQKSRDEGAMSNGGGGGGSSQQPGGAKPKKPKK